MVEACVPVAVTGPTRANSATVVEGATRCAWVASGEDGRVRCFNIQLAIRGVASADNGAKRRTNRSPWRTEKLRTQTTCKPGTELTVERGATRPEHQREVADAAQLHRADTA